MYGPSRRIRYDASPEQLQVALELDLGIGSVAVTRSRNDFCACDNAYSWTITFVSMTGDIPLISASNHLTGNGASIGDGIGGNEAVLVTDSTVISGTFVLKYGTSSTSNLAHDIDEDTLRTSITTDLALPVTQ